MPGATLEFASLCLSNALHLLNNAEYTAIQRLKEELGDATPTNIQERILVPASPSLPMKADEVHQLRCVHALLQNLPYLTLLVVVLGKRVFWYRDSWI